MVTLEDACKNALKLYNESCFISGIIDIGNAWVIGIEHRKYGMPDNPPIAISKSTGERINFKLPDKNNFKLLRKGKNIEVPKHYI